MRKGSKKELVGYVSVDSGMVLLVDPCREFDFDAVCAALPGDKMTAEVANGVVASAGYGDGRYPVFATTVPDQFNPNHRRVVKLEILMDFGQG